MIVTPQETFLTLKEAAEACRCSVNTLRSIASTGKVGFKVGKEYGFLASDLAQYLKNNTAERKEAIEKSKPGRSLARARLEKILKDSKKQKKN